MHQPPRLTIAILAHGRDRDVEASVASCRPEAPNAAVSIVRPLEGSGTAHARQDALNSAATEYIAWLDAGDMWMPGRADRIVALMDAGHDVVIDAVDIHDRVSGAWQQRLTAPALLHGPGGAIRLF